MATPANRNNAQHCLNIGFNYDVEPAEGDLMEITANRVATKISSIGSDKYLGRVISRSKLRGDCVVRTRFNDDRIDRVAGETVVAGKFVFGPGNVVYQYVPGQRAVVTGSATGTQTVVAATSDTAKIDYNNEGPQTFTLTAGARTMAQIAAEINTSAVGFIASVDTAGHLVLTGNEIGKAIEVVAVANDAYTLLGLTAGITRAKGPSHDPSEVAGLIIVGGNGGDTVETLEY